MGIAIHYLGVSVYPVLTILSIAIAIVVGPQKAIALAVRQVKDRQRYTLLDKRLREQ